MPGAKDSATNQTDKVLALKELRPGRWDRQEKKSLPLTLINALGIMCSMFAIGTL